jgi:hypothetical protein
MNTLNSRFIKYDTPIFCLLFIVLGVLQYFFGLQHFYWDAEGYWERGRELKVDGVFSLYNFTTQRGVLFPIVNYGLITVVEYLDWNEIVVFKCLNAIFVTWGFWYVLPGLYAKVMRQDLGVLNKIALVVLGNIFWFRYFSCPLSDFLCLFLLLQGFLLLWSDKVSFARLIIVGIICGFVFNTRPIYNLLLGVYPIFYLLVSKENWSDRIIKIALFVLCAFAINLPQHFLNKKLWQTNTFFQPTEQYYKGQSLYLGQLKWGLYIQKYETYVGEEECYPSAAVFFYHNKETMLNEKPQIDSIKTYSEYFTYVSQHPGKILPFFKNLFNGLDIKYNSAYIYSLKPQLWFSVLNYMLWYVAFLLAVLSWRKWLSTKGFNFILLFLGATCALCIPIAIEVRFLAVLYFLMYLVVVSQAGLLVEFWKKNTATAKILWLAGLVVFVTACCLLSETTYSQLEFNINC